MSSLALLSILVGAMGNHGPLVFRDILVFRLNEPDALFPYNGMLFKP